MYNAAQPASDGGTRIQLLAGVEYRADRIFSPDEPGCGCIELRDFIGGQRLARVTHDAATGQLSMQTLAGPVPQVAVEWLFDEARMSLV